MIGGYSIMTDVTGKKETLFASKFISIIGVFSHTCRVILMTLMRIFRESCRHMSHLRVISISIIVNPR